QRAGDGAGGERRADPDGVRGLVLLPGRRQSGSHRAARLVGWRARSRSLVSRRPETLRVPRQIGDGTCPGAPVATFGSLTGSGERRWTRPRARGRRPAAAARPVLGLA